jgi:integrase
MFATAERINEAMRADWPDYRFQQRTSVVQNTKNKKERIAHMPQRLLVALANLPRDDKPFPGRKAPCAASGMRISRRPPRPSPASSA